MSKIVKIYFTDEADLDFINEYTKLITMMFDLEDKIIAIPTSVVTDVVITEDGESKGVDYPF